MMNFSLLREILKTVFTRTNLCWLGIFFVSLWPLIANIKAILFNCHHFDDFVIYQQAIYDIWTLGDLNPFLSVRNGKIFNDHFDPVIFLAVAFTAVFGQGFEQLLVFEWLFYAGLLISIAYLFKFNLKDALPYLFCALLTKLFLIPLLYSIHPTTWSALPFFWLTYFLIHQQKTRIALTIFILSLFKESYPFALFPLSFFYAYKKDYRLSVAIAAITLPFIAFELHFREEFFGPLFGFGSWLLRPLIEDPILGIKNIIVGLNYSQFIKMFYPFVIVFALYAKKLKDQGRPFPHGHFIAVLLYLTPLLFLQIVYNRIHYQYGAPFAGILLGLLVSLKMLHNLPKKMLFFAVIIFALSSMGTYTRLFKRVILNSFPKSCTISRARITQNRAVRAKVSTIGRDKIILATKGITPFILRPAKTIDVYKDFSEKRNFYHYIILEGEENIISRCRPLANEIYIDNSELFFAVGNFENCVYPSIKTQE